MLGDREFYQAITGLSDKDMELDKSMAGTLSCMNCDTLIPEWILEDAGDVMFLGDYDCESCCEPLG